MMLTSSPSVRYEVIYEMVSHDDNLLNIGWLCEIAGVSRSGYYYWLNAEKGRLEREAQDRADFDIILAAYKHRGYDKGIRGIHMRLLHLKEPVVMNPKKISRLMHKFNLVCAVRKANPYRRMSKAMMTNHVAPNLLNREFKAHGARSVLLTDITYIPRYNPYGDERKFSYLSVIMDAYTREVLAYVLSINIDVDFVLETVNLLMQSHGSELKTDTLIHSDQGCHYTSHKFQEVIASSELRQSMSRKGNCWDNAPQESLFGHMKDDLRILPSHSHQDIKQRVDDWMDYYNNDRYQWSLAKLSPREFYRYAITGEYPLPITAPKELFGGAAPGPPEFIALVSKEGGDVPET
jgi:Transposase and inactivated derivatives